MSYVEIPLTRLAWAAALIAIALWFSRRSRLNLEGEILWSAVRAAVQLIAIGYFLLLLFGHERPEWVGLTLLVMLVVATITGVRRVAHGPGAKRLFPYALASILAGAAFALLPVFLLIVPPKPWFEARYVVPLGGMMLSAAMNVVALVFERLFSSVHAEAATIEQRLALGASSKQASEKYVRAAVNAAMIPTINSLLTVGLVTLPGMMTGQILSGTVPSQAVRYQIVIMYQTLVVAAVSGTLAAAFARRLLFTKREQLVLPSER